MEQGQLVAQFNSLGTGLCGSKCLPPMNTTQEMKTHNCIELLDNILNNNNNNNNNNMWTYIAHVSTN